VDDPAAADLVELTRASMEATNRLDFGAAVEVFASDAVFDVSAAGVGRFEGRDAVRAYLEDWIGSYAEQRFSDWQGEDLGAGVVFVITELDARMRGSDATVRERWAFVVVWREGSIVSVRAQPATDQARREAVALARAAP